MYRQRVPTWQELRSALQCFKSGTENRSQVLQCVQLSLAFKRPWCYNAKEDVCSVARGQDRTQARHSQSQAEFRRDVSWSDGIFESTMILLLRNRLSFETLRNHRCVQALTKFEYDFPSDLELSHRYQQPASPNSILWYPMWTISWTTSWTGWSRGRQRGRSSTASSSPLINGSRRSGQLDRFITIQVVSSVRRLGCVEFGVLNCLPITAWNNGNLAYTAMV